MARKEKPVDYRPAYRNSARRGRRSFVLINTIDEFIERHRGR